MLTRRGSVPGVVTVKSTHLQRVRNPNAPLATLDDLWVDIGATSRAEVQRMRIQPIDPVVRDFSKWTYGDYVAGPSAAARVGCAAVASAANGEVSSGETIFLITSLRSFGHDGLAAALRSIGRVDEITVLEQPSENSSDAVMVSKVEKPAYLPDSTGLTSVTVLAPRVRFRNSLVESVRVGDANRLLDVTEKAASVRPSTGRHRWTTLQPAPGAVIAVDPFTETGLLLQSLADIPSVSGHEREVREESLRHSPCGLAKKL